MRSSSQPLDCKYSNRGKFPLGSYQVEKSTCFVLVFHAFSSLCFSLFFSLCLSHKEHYYFLKTDYCRVTGLICCSSRWLLTAPYDVKVVILAGPATNRECWGGRGVGLGSILALSMLIWTEPPIRLLVVKQAVIRGGSRTFGRKKNLHHFSRSSPIPLHTHPSQTVQLFLCRRQQQDSVKTPDTLTRLPSGFTLV